MQARPGQRAGPQRLWQVMRFGSSLHAGLASARPARRPLSGSSFLFSLPPPPLQKYIDLVAEGDPAWESHPALAEYKEEEAAQ